VYDLFLKKYISAALIIAFDNGHLSSNVIYKFVILFPLIDIDECASPAINDCDENALCSNIAGSYICRCKRGFKGDGRICKGTLKSNRSSLTVLIR